jgi:hypothetical protein
VTASGYLHPLYARSFSEFGTPRELAHCGGWILERPIPGTELRDGMGCYPVFACRDWGRIELDLQPLREELVSLTLVTDPFGRLDEETLGRSFDLVRPYKQHHVTDLGRPDHEVMSRSHRRKVAKARDRVAVETCMDPVDVKRHGIGGIRAFSRAAFARQLEVPGLVMFRATAEGQVVGMHLWYLHDDVAYAHLGAMTDLGYRLSASYALDGYAIEQFRDRVRWLDLGGAAGLEDGDADRGLREYKQHWSTGTLTAYLCGAVLHPEPYGRLARARGDATAYFPAYRAGEFGSP